MRRILIVDDEEDIRFSLRLLLKDAGYAIMVAGDGIAAEELLNENEFDLIITDLVMSNMEGIELITSIKRNFPEVKIIAMSGGGMMIDPVEKVAAARFYLKAATQFGADYTLQKPFGNNILLEYVADCFALEKAKHD